MADKEISDLSAATLPLSGGELVHIDQRGNSRKASVQDLTATAGTLVGSFAKWTAAKARGASNPARFVAYGDSHTMGQGTSTGTDGLAGAVATSMTRVLADLAGMQVQSFFGEQNATVTLPVYDPRVTLGTGWAREGTVSRIFGGRMLTAAGGAAGRVRFTPSGSVVKFRVYLPRNSGLNSAMTVSIDGALVDTFSIAGSQALTVREYDVTPGSHYIEVGAGASGSAYLCGVEAWDGTDSPILLQGGWAGALVSDLNTATFPWASRPALAIIDPDYTIIQCTINDMAANTALNTYYSAMEQIVEALAPTSDGCLVVGFPANSAGATSGYYEDQLRILRNIASDYGWSMYDLRQNYGRSYRKASANGYAYDNFHTNASGAVAGGAGLFDFLSAAGL